VSDRQHALTVVAPIRKDREGTIASSLKQLEDAVIGALQGVKSLHFARFVVLSGRDGAGSLLAFESNYDGELAPHLAELASAMAPFEDATFGSWADYRVGELAAFVASHAQQAAAFYLGHPGLSVEQIKNDEALRDKLEGLLDGAVRDKHLDGRSAVAIRGDLLQALKSSDLVVGPVDRGLPQQPQATITLVGVGLATAVLAVGVLPAAVAVEAHEAEHEPARELVGEDDPRLDAIIAHEDSVMQNGLTHHVPLRPGWVRKNILKTVLWFVEQVRRTIAYQGALADISSIHFARWVLLEDDTLLFFSNYDGSWESYLGDFVDKAHIYLTAVWSNTKWFPKTRGLIFDGAAHEASFKQWARTFQVTNQIWYSAYPQLTVTNILNNAKIREGAGGTMSEEQARAWLALL